MTAPKLAKTATAAADNAARDDKVRRSPKGCRRVAMPVVTAPKLAKTATAAADNAARNDKVRRSPKGCRRFAMPVVTAPKLAKRAPKRAQLGMTLIEVMISLTVMGMMLVSIWSGFKGTIKGMEVTEEIQFRYSTVRNGLSRMTSEMGMAYLSFNRPLDDERHYTLFEGRDGFDADSVTFSSFGHLRVRKDSNESDQSVIQYFVQQDPDDKDRSHLYRRESRRLTGDRPEDLEDFFPAYILIEDVVKFDAKYWDSRDMEWRDEWATMRVDMQPDRLPERVKLTIVIADGKDEVEFNNQVVLPMQEKIDLSKNINK